ncbi:MAG: ABC transporter ATP-binding protein [Bacteriovoracia bacterium]
MKKFQALFDDISGKKLDDRVVFRLLPYLRPHLLRFTGAVLLVFFSAGIALYAPKLLGRIVDQALIPKDYSLLQKLALLFAGLELLRIASGFLQSYQLQSIGQSVMHQIRRDLFGRLLRMPVPFFDKNPTGKLVTRVTNDTVNLSELFSAGFVLLLSDTLIIVGVIAAMIAIHWQLGLIAISVFPLMLFFMYYFSGRLRHAFRHSRELLARLNAFFAERMAGMPIVQLMEREKFERQSFHELSKEYRNRQFQGVYIYSLFHPAITILSAASVALVLWFGPGFMQRGDFALGTFVTFLAYVQILYQPVRNITDRYNVFLAAMSSAERIFTLMDMAEESDLRGPTSMENRAEAGKVGALQFENVRFTYPTGESAARTPALDGLTFSLAEGETVAIVGHTGAGKTTIASLLFRFYEPDSGKILLGGKNLKEIPKLELRQRIGFVQQDVFLFSGTLRENLMLLRSGLSDKAILEGCEHTGFAKIVARLPKGLDTALDERGSNLSLGERQILAFTRVYLQKPEILILDEATSSVDRDSERQLQLATKELMKERSSLVIAHRLETVREANRILVLDHGKLIEQGSHSELLAANSTYARFVKLQSSVTHPS